MLLLATFLTASAAVVGGLPTHGSKTLISFPGATWIENNDPVMGGQSHGNWSVVNNSFGRFQGTVKNVSFLHAPGFCRAVTVSLMFKDVSAYLSGGLLITARTSTPNYAGFKVSFGALGAPRHHGGHEIEGSYKTDVALPTGPDGAWQTLFLPFNTFSSDWSDYTGKCSTKDPDGYQHVCCTKDTPAVCPDSRRLKGVNSFNVWAEGVEGDFLFDLKEIAAASDPPWDIVV